MRLRKRSYSYGMILLIAICSLSARRGDMAEQQNADQGQSTETQNKFSSADQEFFEKEIRPILVVRCHECHNDKDHKGGLRLTSRDNVIKGGESGAAIVPGDANQSELIRAIRYDGDSYQMPPKGKLPDEEIDLLTEWVNRKAPWSKFDSKSTADDAGNRPVISFEERANQWPFTPLSDVPPPSTGYPSWERNLIDTYILSALENADLQPAAEADKRTWLRRVTYDLIGLPPTPDEIADFLTDDSPDSYERVIDRLLSSVQYGERWGRHWLDLVRYAETLGHEFDFEILHAWQYRDYVIRALNESVPYDQFLIEHLAGDLLEHPRRDLVSRENESIKGTAFYWLGQGKHSPVDIRAEECDTVDNQIDVFSKTFLGLTVACARCHDHKFDPIRAADYYALAGYLQSSRQQWVDVTDPVQNSEIVRELNQLHGSLESLYAQRWQVLTADDRIQQLFMTTQPLLGRLLIADESFPDPRIEGEKLTIAESTGGKVRPQAMESFGKGKWSNESHLWWTDGKVGDRLTLKIPAPEPGRFEILIGFTKARDYGIVSLKLDDRPVGKPIDLYDPQVVPTGPMSLGIHEWQTGDHRLSLTIEGRNDKSVPGYMVGIDYVALVPRSSDANNDDDAASLAEIDPRILDFAKAIQRGTSDNPVDLLVPWNVLSQAKSGDEFLKKKQQLHDEWTNRLATGASDQSRPQWTDFTGEGLHSWNPSGFAFQQSTVWPSELIFSDSDEMPGVSVVTRGGMHSGRIAERLQGFVRSPTFRIEQPYIDYLVRRTGGLANPGRATKNGNISLVIDGFQVIRSPLYGNLSIIVPNDGEWHWLRQDVRKHQGRTAYIEIGDEDEGFIEVADIRLSDQAFPEKLPNPLVLSLLANESIDSPEKLAEGYARLLKEAFSSWRQARQVSSPQFQASAELVHLVSRMSAALTAVSESDETTGTQLQSNWLQIVELHQQRQKLGESIRLPVWALAMADGTPEDEHILVRGNHTKNGELVERRFLEIFNLTTSAAQEAESFPEKSASGRLELARTIVADAEPLIARVIVNRIWQHHFGEGIVPTPDNFGALGMPPSHPELLDTLARELIAHDWSLKHIHRLIVSSATYRMVSESTDPSAEERDPNNILLHRMNVKRLEGEPLRDAILALSGELNAQMYGPSVMPHLTPFMEGRGRPGQSGPLDGDGRRSIYIGVRRNFLTPMFLAFDLPTPLSTMGKRSTSNVPAQALTLMNNPLVVEQSARWMQRLNQLRELNDDERIVRMYEEAFGRHPTAKEHQLATSFLESGDDASKWNDLAHLLVNLKEFVFIP